ncbi:hypothetical protein J9303_00475 [Bacillaceae bacterium Marseille-Q3522]|nr:hypothetical protein [Bacillaceae bacterium Marseille-Q3522]
MNARRWAIERLYKGQMTVIADVLVKVGSVTETVPTAVIENEKCRLSQKTITATGDGEYGDVFYVSKLFCAPELEIPPGSKIVITQSGVTLHFKRSGESMTYDTHQEIILARDEKA